MMQFQEILLLFRLKFFDVDPKTGEIFVKNSNLIDREVNSLYSGTLQARDSANNIGTTVLEIILTDINDKPPVISRESYMGLVREGPDGQLRVQIQVCVYISVLPGCNAIQSTIEPDNAMSL